MIFAYAGYLFDRFVHRACPPLWRLGGKTEA